MSESVSLSSVVSALPQLRSGAEWLPDGRGIQLLDLNRLPICILEAEAAIAPWLMPPARDVSEGTLRRREAEEAERLAVWRNRQWSTEEVLELTSNLAGQESRDWTPEDIAVLQDAATETSTVLDRAQQVGERLLSAETNLDRVEDRARKQTTLARRLMKWFCSREQAALLSHCDAYLALINAGSPSEPVEPSVATDVQEQTEQRTIYAQPNRAGIGVEMATVEVVAPTGIARRPQRAIPDSSEWEALVAKITV